MHDMTQLAEPCTITHGALQPVRAVRKGCASTSESCLRCDVTAEGRCADDAALLLGAQDADAAAVLRTTLDTQGFSYHMIGPLLVLPNVRRKLAAIGEAINAEISPYTQSCIRAAYVPGGANNAEEALAAVLFAEPLTQLIKHVEYEWMRDALAEDWLYSVFQPIIEAQTGKTHAHEALLRARHPEGHVIAAGSLLQACEALNLQHQLDQRARRSAIRHAAEVVPDPTKVFINFLPNTIYDPEVCLRTTVDEANRCGVTLSRLVFEVVETEKIPDMKRLQVILDYYRASGAGTAVDDMGTGFTSIEYLTTLRPDYVKLDRDRVVAAMHDRTKHDQFEKIVRTAQQLGIHTVAEGIETREQMQLCLQQEVEFLQGYLFAKPANPPHASVYPDLMQRVDEIRFGADLGR